MDNAISQKGTKMNNTEVELQIFSPRWGHEDTYKFELTNDSLTITMHPRITICTWHDNIDPEWSGEGLEKTLRNDSIYPPSIFQDLVEHAWKEWRVGELDDAEVNAELQELASWLNKITLSKPDTDFWKGYF